MRPSIGETTQEPSLGVHPLALMFFADETGHEEFADPNFPVFGIGGCAIIAKALDAELRNPWLHMKAEHFGGPDTPLHAADLRSPTPEQMNALSLFFTKRPIGRFAATLSIDTKLPERMPPYEAVAMVLRERFAELSNRAANTIEGVGLVFEGSDRGDKFVERYFGQTKIMRGDRQLPFLPGLMRKKVGEPALEVADFIAHTAGCQARAWASGSRHFRRDFQDIFQYRIRSGLVFRTLVGSGHRTNDRAECPQEGHRRGHARRTTSPSRRWSSLSASGTASCWRQPRRSDRHGCGRSATVPRRSLANARLRADARSGDGGVRQVVAAGELATVA